MHLSYFFNRSLTLLCFYLFATTPPDVAIRQGHALANISAFLLPLLFLLLILFFPPRYALLELPVLPHLHWVRFLKLSLSALVSAYTALYGIH